MKLTFSSSKNVFCMGIFRFSVLYQHFYGADGKFYLWNGKTLRVVQQIQGSLVKHKSLQMEYEIVVPGFWIHFSYMAFMVWHEWRDFLFLFGAKLI